MTQIVTVLVSQQIAPTPDTLQKTGALISQGGTNTTKGTKSLLTDISDLTPLLVQPAAITSLFLSTSQIATVTTTQVHGLPMNDDIAVTIAGSVGATTPNIFNGTFTATVTGNNTFTYPLAGTTQAGTGGTWAPASSGELFSMANTFFKQGSSQGVYVLELGAGNPSEGISFLSAWIAANPGVFYSYLVPRAWDAVPGYLSLLTQFNSTTAKTYFTTTTTLATYSAYSALQKACFALIEAPSYGIWPANALTSLSFSGAWAANAFTALTWAATNGGQATATTTTAHGVQPGQTVAITGCTPAGYNGTFVALPGTTGSTLIYALPVNPGSETALGTLVASTSGTATAATTTAHGVLPGQTFAIVGSVASIVSSGYNGTFTALPGTTASTILYSLTVNPGTESVPGALRASYTASAGIAAGEFSAAAPFYAMLNYKPSTTNKVTPTAYSFLFGVTPFPTSGNGAVLQLLQDAAVNVVGTGAAGGISNAILIQGQTKDGRDFTYWYSVDWAQINIARDITAAIINGSNNPLNPLYYDQNGINRLSQVAAGTLSRGLTYGLVLGAVTQTQLDGTDFDTALDAGTYNNQSVINAIPFVPYSTENPGDYKIGQYDGLSAVYTPARGFLHIVFVINVTDFITT